MAKRPQLANSIEKALQAKANAGLVLGGNHLRAEVSFHYWCEPERLRALLDETQLSKEQDHV